MSWSELITVLAVLTLVLVIAWLGFSYFKTRKAEKHTPPQRTGSFARETPRGPSDRPAPAWNESGGSGPRS